MTTQAMAVRDVSEAGFEDLSHSEMKQVNGGGWWGVVRAFLAAEITIAAFTAAIIFDFLLHPEDAIRDFMEGLEEGLYGET